jgi:hypothetical protein
MSIESAYGYFVESFQPDLEQDSVLVWVAEQFANCELPPYWSEHIDHEGRFYYFDALTKTSQWVHPLEDLFARVVVFLKPIRMEILTSRALPVVDDLVALVEAELRLGQEASLARIDGWSGPYVSVTEDGEQREYFFHAALGISSWDSPLVQVEFELSLRHSLLMEALFSADQLISEEDLSPRLAFLSDKLKLPLHLLQREISDLNDNNIPPSPSSSAYYSARSPHHSQRDHPPPPVTSP